MRGEAELNCFNLVKEKMKTNFFFAMSYVERDLIESVFLNAIPNPKPSSFPDFLFDTGFIEHFRVTSSTENRNGSLMQIEKAEIGKDYQKRVKEALTDLPKDCISFHSVETPQRWHEQHEYNNFIASFKTNLEHHIESMKKYSGEKKCRIFMVEYTDSALRMSKVYPKDLRDGVSYGDLMVREPPVYRLSRDKNLLTYLHEKKEEIDYFIFVNNDVFLGTFIDIIKVSNALEIIKLLHEGYSPYCAKIGSSECGFGVSIPNT